MAVSVLYVTNEMLFRIFSDTFPPCFLNNEQRVYCILHIILSMHLHYGNDEQVRLNRFCCHSSMYLHSAFEKYESRKGHDTSSTHNNTSYKVQGGHYFSPGHHFSPGLRVPFSWAELSFQPGSHQAGWPGWPVSPSPLIFKARWPAFPPYLEGGWHYPPQYLKIIPSIS